MLHTLNKYSASGLKNFARNLSYYESFFKLLAWLDSTLFLLYYFSMKKALITGVTGQDGSYLAELLLEKGYQVYGLQRRSSAPNTFRIDHLYDNPQYPHFVTAYADLADSSNLSRLVAKIQPDEIYNLGAQSHVRVSFDVPEYTANVTGLGPLRILDAIRDLK